MIKVNKPILGENLDVIIKSIEKKGTEDRWTRTITMQLVSTGKEFKDVIFFNTDDDRKGKVLMAIINAIANQLGIAQEEYTTETDGDYDIDEDYVFDKAIGKQIKVTRRTSTSERNDQVYYNTYYNVVTDNIDSQSNEVVEFEA